jgi:hypothetical protein
VIWNDYAEFFCEVVEAWVGSYSEPIEQAIHHLEVACRCECPDCASFADSSDEIATC